MIHFVGAGPGAVDLITVRGRNLLMEADVIIYAGSLVNKDHLEIAKAGCKFYDSSHMTLEEVIEVMENTENDNKMTVRLHTGDPSVYGAIREQMDILNELNIEYDVVPGVSSFCGAAAALKAEYTLPNVSQTVIITRMGGRTPVPEKEDMALLASHNATMVIFLSITLIDSLKEKLIAGGYSKDTPAAIVHKATWKDEKIYRGTIETIADIAKNNNITKTALIIIGNFLGTEYDRSKLYDPSFTHEFRKAIK
jgi:precorrin-4/cobalt-precorrin-4 C11-methyltransferase